MGLASPESLRSELSKDTNLSQGTHETSVLHFGCEGCPNGHRIVAPWLSTTKLITIMNNETNLPRGFVQGNMSGVGKAQGCPVGENGEPNCQHEDNLKTVIQRTNPFPDI